MLGTMRFLKKRRMAGVRKTYPETYDDVVLLCNNEELDYEFFVKEYINLMLSRKEIDELDATFTFDHVEMA